MQRFWLVFTLATASLLGLLAIVAPVWILDLRGYTAPLFPLIRSGVEGMSLLTLVCLFCAGFLVGCFGVGHPLLLGHSRAAPDIGDRGDERFIHNTQSLAARIHHLWRHQSVCGCRGFRWTICEAPSKNHAGLTKCDAAPKFFATVPTPKAFAHRSPRRAGFGQAEQITGRLKIKNVELKK